MVFWLGGVVARWSCGTTRAVKGAAPTIKKRPPCRPTQLRFAKHGEFTVKVDDNSPEGFSSPIVEGTLAVLLIVSGALIHLFTWDDGWNFFFVGIYTIGTFVQALSYLTPRDSPFFAWERFYFRIKWEAIIAAVFCLAFIIYDYFTNYLVYN